MNGGGWSVSSPNTSVYHQLKWVLRPSTKVSSQGLPVTGTSLSLRPRDSCHLLTGICFGKCHREMWDAAISQFVHTSELLVATALGGRGQGATGFHTLHWKGFWRLEKVGCRLPAKLNTNKRPSGPSLKTFCSVFSEIPFPGYCDRQTHSIFFYQKPHEMLSNTAP